VIKGFGRGSKELGIPTANIPIEGLSIGGQKELETGIYFGWAGLGSSSVQAQSHERRASISEKVKAVSDKIADSIKNGLSNNSAASNGSTYPMVMSIGWNPFYKNSKRSVEVHIINKFEKDFYGKHLNLVILGFIRPEYDYLSRESLIEDIETDIEVAKRSLERAAYKKFREDAYLTTFASRADV